MSEKQNARHTFTVFVPTYNRVIGRTCCRA
jgi:hypothetical protein